MFFSKPISDLSHKDVEEFCKRFREGLRVEYKSTFDASVKKKLPRVVSSFANSYGGILVVGINTSKGIPQEPFEGLEFEDREPRLTVENVCREGVFPEVLIHQSLVSSRTSGKAFLVIEVPESPKAPHAIENSTQVYVRTGDSANPADLAKMDLLERLLLRRQDVLRRWDDFLLESWQFANGLNIDQRYAYREIMIGPLYPSERLLTREAVYGLLNSERCREISGFHAAQILRTPIGAVLVREENGGRYLGAGELGLLHYIEPSYPRSYQGGSKSQLDFWPMAVPIFRLLRLSGELIECAGAMCQMRIEAHLRNISGQSFSSNLNPYNSLEIKSIAQSVQATTHAPSHDIAQSAMSVTAELMYQLRWPFGAMAAPTREQVRCDLETYLKGV